MGALSWLHVRPRTLIGAGIVSVAAIGITTMAVAYEGNPTTELDLNDGSVWITYSAKGWVGHFNAESRVLDGKFSAPTADYDVLQDADVALVHDLGDNSLGRIDAAAMSLPSSVKLPTKAQTDYANQTVAILDPAKGSVYVIPLTGLSGFEVGTTKPVLEDLGKDAVVTVSRAGTVYAASPDQAALYTVPVTPEGAPVKDGISQQPLEGVDKTSTLQLSSVGDRPVVLDEQDGVVLVPGLDPYTLGEPDDAQLAQDAADGDAAVLATRSALIRLPFDGSEPVSADAGGTTGTPAAPVWLNGCAYGAWMESGAFVRDCTDDAFDQTTDIEKYEPGGELRFRVNRDVVMLNDVVNGGAWLASDVLQKVDNWSDLTPPTGDGVENPDPTTVQVPDPSPPDRGEKNTPPIANPDTFGVRAGASTILPVLDNDSDPDGDVLVVRVEDQPGGGASGVDVQPVNDGTALQITVPQGVTSVDDFEYTVDDGRNGGTDTAEVRVDVRPERENKAPVQLRKIALPVETGTEITYNVLPDWIDPDGDSTFLENVVPAEGDTVRFTADGRITYRAISGNTGPIEVAVTISDGTASQVGVFALDVYPEGSKPPLATADHLVVREGQVGTVDPLANDLSASDEPLVLTQVSQVDGAEIVPDYTDGTFTFQAGKADTYYIDYKVMTSGTTPVPGLVRVDVVKPDRASAQPPVAVRDIALLPSGGDALVNVLANDSDPAGGVLVVQSVDVPEDAGVAVSVINHETLRVTDAGLSGGDAPQAKVRYTVSNGDKTAEGEVVVLPTPAPAKVLGPAVNPDEAKVRVGDVVTIPVLDNDYHPNDLDMRVLSDLGGQSEGAFVSEEKYVRYEAGDEPGDVHLQYTVEDENQAKASADVTIRVLPLDAENNNTPRPATVEARTVAGTAVPLEVPLDGIDPDGDSVEFVGTASTPTKGKIDYNSNGQLMYTALPGVSGLDTFSYRVRDALGAVATGTIRVGIAEKPKDNHPPFAVRDSLVVKPGRVVTANVLANDSDPDGGEPTLVQGEDALILGEDPQVEAEVFGNQVMVTAPDEPIETSLQYTIEDAQGARARGVLQITVSDDAPPVPPLVRDDYVLAEKIDAESDSTDIDISFNDQDPDGTTDAMTYTIDDPDDGIAFDPGSKTATVTVKEDRRLIKYTAEDVDGNTAEGFIHVPGQEDLRPQLVPNIQPAVVESGKQKTLALADYVKAMDGKQVQLTSAETVTAAHSNGAPLVVDAHTLTYTSSDRYSGADAITVEVTDGQSADDPGGRTSILSIPITVLPPSNEPPEMSGAEVTVGAGDSEPGSVDLAGLATDIDQDPITFTVQSQPDGVSATIVDGTTLEVTADPDAKGTSGDIVILADDGQDNPDFPEPTTAAIAVTVTASTRPMPVATDETFPEWNQGARLDADVLKNDVNPFADEGEPLRIIDARVETGTPEQAGLDWNESGLSVTPASDFHGRLVIRYTIQDKTGDPDRTAQARVNVTVQGAPDAPTKPRVSNEQSRQLTLSWDAPADNGAPISGYKVVSVKGDPYEADCPQTTCVLKGLTNNVTYAFQVTAINKVGASDPSPVSQTGRPDVRPHTPAAPSITGFGDGSLTVVWTRPTSEGSPVTSYTLEVSPALPNGVTQLEIEDGSAGRITRTIDGLANGTPYTFRVNAHNLAPEPSGWSGRSAQVAPAKPPAAPGAPKASRAGSIGETPGAVDVSWNAVVAPGDGGDPVDAYQVQAYAGGAPHGEPKSVTGTSTSFSLPPSSSAYTFKVKAKNKAGWGGWSTASAPLRQFTAPSAPGTPVAKVGDRQFTASWAPATADGADEIHYEYLASGGSWTDVGPATKATIPAVNGQAYTVQVRAYSVAAGEPSEPGAASAASNSVTPYGAPNQPGVSGRISGGAGRQVSFTWTMPAQNGRPYTALKYQIDDGAVQTVEPRNGTWGPKQFDYHTTHSIEAWTVDSEGQESSHSRTSVTTRQAPPPAPSGTTTFADSPNPNGVVDGCSYTCKYLQLNYKNVPRGTYNLQCQENTGGWRTFSEEGHTLSGDDSLRLRCAYGYTHDVRVIVTGPPATFTAD